VIRVPVNPDFFSLNLAQAVLLVAYEWFQSTTLVPRRQENLPAGRAATKGELDQLLEHLIAELDAVDFFRTADRRASMSRALRLIFARAELREPDVHLLRGVIKEIARGGRRPPRAAG
jgi:tRNA/rRNA methyltransferase